MITQVYVDDIILGVTKESLCEDFANLMKGIRNEHDERTYIFSWSSKQTDGWRYLLTNQK